MKQQLLLTLFSSLVLSSSGSNEYSISNEELVIYCSVGGDRVLDDCDANISGTGMTLNHLVMNAFRQCVMEVTGEVVHFSPDGQGNSQNPLNRLLRESDSTITGERLLQSQCYSRCCCSDACMTSGYCASMGLSCGSMSCRRRLSASTGSILLDDPSGVLSELSSACTESVKALPTTFGSDIFENNQCFGTVPERIECTVSVME
jgi:hypothetical protein